MSSHIEFADRESYKFLNNKIAKLKEERKCKFKFDLYFEDKNYKDFGDVRCIYVLISNAIFSVMLEIWLLKQNEEVKIVIELYAFNDRSISYFDKIFVKAEDDQIKKSIGGLRDKYLLEFVEERKNMSVIIEAVFKDKKDKIEAVLKDNIAESVMYTIESIIDIMEEYVNNNYINFDADKCIKGMLEDFVSYNDCRLCSAEKKKCRILRRKNDAGGYSTPAGTNVPPLPGHKKHGNISPL